MPYRFKSAKADAPDDGQFGDLVEFHPSALTVEPKVTAATLGGALATIAIITLEANGVTVTAELGAAVATAAAAILGWAAKS